MPTASPQMMTQLLDDFKKVTEKITKIQEHHKNYKENSDDKKDAPSAEPFKAQLTTYTTVKKEKIDGFIIQFNKSPKVCPDETPYKDARSKVTNIMKYLEMTEKAVEKEKLALAEQIKKRADTDALYIKNKCPDFASAGSTYTKSGDYWGGADNSSHVHVYGGGFHLKLGDHRYNIVQDGKLYRSGVYDAHEALKSRKEKDMVAGLRAAVKAALVKYKIM